MKTALENVDSAGQIRDWNMNLDIESTRAQKSRVKIFLFVGGPNHDDALILHKSIHFGQ